MDISTLYFPHYEPGSSKANEYRQTTTKKGQKKENRRGILVLKHSVLNRIQR